MSRLFIGVDAGGSHTAAVVADGAGIVRGIGRGEPGAVRPGHEAEAAERIIATCRAALEQAEPGAIAAVLVVGAAGVGDPGPRRVLREALVAAGLAERVDVTTDAEIALATAFGDGPGIVLLAGTGSIAWARLPDGSMARAGGLGPAVGDPGSGHDLGRHALRAAAQALSGQGPSTLLAARCAEHAGVAVTSLTAWSVSAPVEQVAALAPLVLDAAADADVVAAEIVASGAHALARFVAELAGHFGPGATVPLAVGGGLLLNRLDYERLVLDQVALLCPTAEMASPVTEPVLGALWMARRV